MSRVWVLGLDELAAAQVRAAENGEYARAQEYLYWIEDYEQRGRKVVRCWCGELHRDTVSAFCTLLCAQRYAAAQQHPAVQRARQNHADFGAWLVQRGPWARSEQQQAVPA
jgi:hypothetical protein